MRIGALAVVVVVAAGEVVVVTATDCAAFEVSKGRAPGPVANKYGVAEKVARMRVGTDDTVSNFTAPMVMSVCVVFKRLK